MALFLNLLEVPATRLELGSFIERELVTTVSLFKEELFKKDH